ncbi:MAG: SPOR domain-containing protein [Marinilabiliaceae bacterium]|nr:SPOR domain-containing protein [Marinilabiliaceae bacterium]
MTKKILVAVILAVLVCSCASKRKGTTRFDDNISPYVKEEQTSPYVKEEQTSPYIKEEVTVREEKVKTIDEEDVIYDFYVIIGSFKVVDNARKFRTELTEEGFKPVVLEGENDYYRVSVGSFNDENAARTRIRQIRNNYEKYSDVWLLIRKK